MCICILRPDYRRTGRRLQSTLCGYVEVLAQSHLTSYLAISYKWAPLKVWTMYAVWVINYDRAPTYSDESRYSDEVDSLGVPGQVGVVTIALEKQDQHPGDQERVAS